MAGKKNGLYRVDDAVARATGAKKGQSARVETPTKKSPRSGVLKNMMDKAMEYTSRIKALQ